MNQRVGMTMHQPPLRFVAAKDQGHAQRPVLIRQTADLAMLPFDHHQNDQVSGRVRLDDLQLRLAALKISCQGVQSLVRRVEAAPRFSAERLLCALR